MPTYKKILLQYRQRIIEAQNKVQDLKTLAEKFGINLQTAYHWLGNDHLTSLKRGRTIHPRNLTIS